MASSPPSQGSRAPTESTFVEALGLAAKLLTTMLATTLPLLMATLIVFYAFVAADVSYADKGVMSPVCSQVRNLLWFGAFSGVLSMALVEVAKRLFGIRGLYQRRQIRQWFVERSDPSGGQSAFAELLVAVGLNKAEGSQRQQKRSGLKRLRFEQDLERFFDLPMEQLAAQVSDAVEVAITNPREYRSMLAGLGAPPNDYGAKGGGLTHEVERNLALSARAGIDALQISVGERWRRYVRSTAVWVSGAVGVLLTRYGDFTEASRPTFILTALFLGGAVAWSARDVSAGLEKWRR
jgi:hypothetical protein